MNNNIYTLGAAVGIMLGTVSSRPQEHSLASFHYRFPDPTQKARILFDTECEEGQVAALLKDSSVRQLIISVALTHTDANYQARAMQLFAQFPDSALSEIFPALEKGIISESPLVRWEAALTCEKLGTKAKACAESLTIAWKNEGHFLHSVTFEHAIRAVTELEPDAYYEKQCKVWKLSVPSLLEKFRSADFINQNSAAKELVRIADTSPDVQAKLYEEVSTALVDRVRGILQAVTSNSVAPERYAPIAVQSLFMSHLGVRFDGEVLCRRIGKERGLKFAYNSLQDEDDRVRGVGLLACAFFGAPAEEMRKRLEDFNTSNEGLNRLKTEYLKHLDSPPGQILQACRELFTVGQPAQR